MNFKHAVGFLIIGTIFGMLPRVAPGWFSTSGLYGSSTRELWLQLMSFVQLGLAGGFFLQRVCSVISSMLEYLPATVTAETAIADDDELIVAPEPAQVPVRRPALPARLGARGIMALPESLNAGLLEPRQAA